MYHSLDHPVFIQKQLTAHILRLDTLHPVVSGNKWFKLRYYIGAAKAARVKTLVTFGGAYSNHIVATAFACKAAGLPCAGIIRGERPAVYSPTLQDAERYGMQLHFVSRSEYRHKDELLATAVLQHDDFYLVNEGGYGALGVKGAGEILWVGEQVEKKVEKKVEIEIEAKVEEEMKVEIAAGIVAAPVAEATHICCAVGSGTMLAGLITAAAPQQQCIGISSMKGNTALTTAVQQLLPAGTGNWRIVHDYHFGGYAKADESLFHFMNEWYNRTGIPLDFVYTAKLMYGVLDLAAKDYFPPGAQLLLIHSGGLQGNRSLPAGTLHY
jgi:1-aminocyclopropane-1-carboxylate deaminase/D-cysteine desulfhydrase-like pyridoxal-dependent ACC family enzyme